MKRKIAVIYGGMSTEHDISLISGKNIILNLDKEKYDIYPITIEKNGTWKYNDKKLENIISTLKKMDVVFPALHGLYGEDGTIQGMLKLAKIKYVGCEVLSSSICMDKVYAKVIFEKAKIPQAKYVYIKNKNIFINESFDEIKINQTELGKIIKQKLGFPVFVKPSNSGSSVGINKANNEVELAKAIELANQYDTKILIEEAIIGKEVECAVLGNDKVEASTVGEILSAEDFYSYDAKYKNSQSKVIIPANLSKNKIEEIRKIAIKAFKAIDGKGLSRVDFFVENKTEKVYINEINTMPGFTEISMYPQLWQSTGIRYSELLDKLIELA